MKTIEINSKSNLENTVKNNAQNGLKPQDNVKSSVPQEKQQEHIIDAKKGASPIAEQKEPKATETAPKLEKPALNLESTLKLVEELHRVNRQQKVDTII